MAASSGEKAKNVEQRRLSHEPIGNIPPAEAEAQHYATLNDSPMAA
jgi:hypothetical protein